MNTIGLFNFLKIKLEKLSDDKKYDEISAMINLNRKNAPSNYLNELFRHFSYRKDIKMMDILLNSGADINYDVNLFPYYVASGNISDIEFLIKKNINMHTNDNEALKIAIFNNDTQNFTEMNFKIMDLLFKNFKNKDMINLSDFTSKLINSYCQYNLKFYMEVLLKYLPLSSIDKDDLYFKYLFENDTYSLNDIKLLLKNGANVQYNDNFLIKKFSCSGSKEIFELLLDYNPDIHVNNDEPFRTVCKNGRINYAKLLLSKGANIHALDDEVFFVACKNKKYNIVKFLLDNGIDINTRNGEILIYCCNNNDTELLKFLIENKIDLSIRDFEAYKIICKNKNDDIVKIILNFGIDCENKNNDILMYCINNSQLLLEFLLENKINISAKNYEAFRYCIEHKKNLVNLFVQKCIDSNIKNEMKCILNQNVKNELNTTPIVQNKTKKTTEWCVEFANKLSKENKFYYGGSKNPILISKASFYWNKNPNIVFIDVLIYNDKIYNVYIADTVEFIYTTIKNDYKIPNLIDLILDQSINIKNSAYNLFDIKSFTFTVSSVNEFKMANKFKELCEKESNLNVSVKKTEYKKKQIPKNVRNDVWRINHEESFNGFCYCCKKIINVNEWECGHIISEKNGGTLHISNLKPVCSPCNKSMGTMNMEVFKNTYYTELPSKTPRSRKINKTIKNE